MTIMAISRDAAGGGTEYATTIPTLLLDPPRVECSFASFTPDVVDRGSGKVTKGTLEDAIRSGAIADVTGVEDVEDMAAALGGSLVRLALPEWQPAADEEPAAPKEDRAAALVSKRAARAEKAAREAEAVAAVEAGEVKAGP